MRHHSFFETHTHTINRRSHRRKPPTQHAHMRTHMHARTHGTQPASFAGLAGRTRRRAAPPSCPRPPAPRPAAAARKRAPRPASHLPAPRRASRPHAQRRIAPRGGATTGRAATAGAATGASRRNRPRPRRGAPPARPPTLCAAWRAGSCPWCSRSRRGATRLAAAACGRTAATWARCSRCGHDVGGACRAGGGGVIRAGNQTPIWQNLRGPIEMRDGGM